MTLKPEKLKAVAELAGHTAQIIGDEVRIQPANGVLRGFTLKYDPRENAEQLLELIEKLCQTGVLEFYANTKRLTTAYMVTYDSQDYFGETLPEAVLAAAIALVGGEDNE